MLLQSFVKPDERSTSTRGSDQTYLERISFQDSVLILGNGILELDPAGLSLKAPATIKAEYITP